MTKKRRCKHWLCLDTIGCFSLGLDEPFGIEPFREFTVPIFARIDKSINSFVGGIIAANIEHVVDKKEKVQTLVVFRHNRMLQLGIG
jgi:hypothetical protein